MATTRFYLDLRGMAKDGKGSIVITIYHNRTTAMIPTGVRVAPNEWDGKHVVRVPGCDAINARLCDRKAKVDKAIRRACGKRKITDEQIRSMIDGVVANLEGDEIPSAKIAELVMERLHKVDEVAYIRFASVYRKFTDVAQFLSAITEIVKK